jgi:hypothetical protein
MANIAKKIGRPRTEPSKVVRLPLPLAAGEALGRENAAGRRYQRLLRRQCQAASHGAADGLASRLAGFPRRRMRDSVPTSLQQNRSRCCFIYLE